MRLVEALPEHIPHLAANMRAHDRRECAAFGKAPYTALEHALKSSLWALTAMEDEPVAMLGVSPRSMIEGIGVPWMLGTERIYDSGRALVALVPPVVAEMRASFERLENVVSKDNDRAISFLRHFGWRVSDEVVPVGGVEFVRFS